MIDIKNAKKIVIIGVPGSGKSFLADKLGRVLEITPLHMDIEFENIVGKGASKERTKIITDRVDEVTRGEKWIIEGGFVYHTEPLELRIKRADLVICLDFDLQFCIESIRERGTDNFGGWNAFKSQSDINDFIVMLTEKFDEGTKKLESAIEKHGEGKTLRLYNREQVNSLIEGL